MKKIRFIPAILTISLLSLFSTASGLGVSAPAGLRNCRSDDPILAVTQKMAASQSLEYLGCFLSDKTVELHGENKGVSHLLTYAYALKISPPGQTSGDLDALYNNIIMQWKNFKPLANDQLEYENKISDLVEKISPENAPKAKIALTTPVLVRIEKLNENSYLVISIRERKVAINSETYISTSIDGTAVLLREGTLVRLSLVRELQSKSDITTVDEAVRNWIRSESQR
jgi:hypothetical protein